MAELLRSFRRFAFRLLPVVCVLLLPKFVVAQSSGNYCEASPVVREDFRKLNAIDDEALPYKTRRDRQFAMLQELLKKHAGNFHVQRRYQNHRQSSLIVDRDALIAEYREQMQKNANDPQATYLYTRLLIGRDTKQSIELLQKLAQQSPDFPWSLHTVGGDLHLRQFPRRGKIERAVETMDREVSLDHSRHRPDNTQRRQRDDDGRCTTCARAIGSVEGHRRPELLGRSLGA